MTLQHVEPDRLASLDTYGLRGQDEVLGLEGIAELAARACGTPTALIMVVEANTLDVVAGVGDTDVTPVREGSLSAWIVDNQVPLVVQDARLDPRFARHPRVVTDNSVAYAGVPLFGRDGLPLGVLCAIDRVPRDFDETELNALRTLAAGVVNVLELRRIDLYRGVPVDAAAQGRRLRRAIEQDEMVAWFQPVVDLATGQPTGLEALIRWVHPQRGVLGPAEFLPAIDHSGLSLPLGRHVLHQSLRVLADLRSRAEVPDTFRVAVNVSPLQLERPGLAGSVLADLAAHRIQPDNLAVEVTEHSVLRHPEVAIRELRQLRDAGVRIALDDYGTGRASLLGLLELPLTSIKLDGCLVKDVTHDSRTRAIVRSTLQMAEELGVGVIAEGIETAEQRAVLQELGCRVGQGHAFAPAVTPADLPALLARMSPDRPTPVRSKAREHGMLLSQDPTAFVEAGADLLMKVLQGTRPVVLIATTKNRVALERTLAARGVSAIHRAGYSVVSADVVLDQICDGTRIDAEAFRSVLGPLVPRGATVWSDLAGMLWATGDVSAAIELEDLLNQLPAEVHCSHESWALAAHGTPQQVQRLQEQHTAAPAVQVPAMKDDVRAALRPDARELIDRMLTEGASPHSVAAALNAEGHPTPWGVRWHWRQVDRVRART